MALKIKTLIHSFFIFFMLFSMQTSFADTGKAFSIEGTATINGEPLTLESVIKQGDVIKTEEGSSVKIIMKDKSVIDIGEASSFEFTEYAYKEDAPEESKGKFSLLEGTFNYISGLIAKKDPDKVKFAAGTATIGIRGTATNISFRNGVVGAASAIGTATINFGDGPPLVISPGTNGKLNFSTGESSVAQGLGENLSSNTAFSLLGALSSGDTTAISNLSPAEATMLVAAVINNQEQMGYTQTSDLVSLISLVVAANPGAAVGMAYVAGALGTNPAVTAAVTTAIVNNASKEGLTPEQIALQEAAIRGASDLGSKLETAPATNAAGEPIFALRQAIDAVDEVQEDLDAAEAEVGAGAGSGSPLTTDQFITITEESNS